MKPRWPIALPMAVVPLVLKEREASHDNQENEKASYEHGSDSQVQSDMTATMWRGVPPSSLVPRQGPEAPRYGVPPSPSGASF
jgi:hypothetical protein